jgi:phosphodiesterase/alkaline phosphatase D-like protein
MKVSRTLPLIIVFLIAAFSFYNAQAPVNFTGPELLGRPTNNSVTLNVVANAAVEGYVQYGTESGSYSDQTGVVSALANLPLEITLNGLQSNTRYFYRMLYRRTGATAWIARDEHAFSTQRSPGSTFTFTIAADSHINILFGDASLYQQTLLNAGNDQPDFHLDLGDTFAMDNVNTQAQAYNAYLAQRPFMGLLSHSVPIFLALGNHEQEERWHLDDTGNPATSRPVMGANARKRYFLNPIPDAFYSGNIDKPSASISGDQLPEDYYAWEWGDALFVVIDPYWYTGVKPFIGNIGGGESSDVGSGDRWDWTLGPEQYQWLKQTLENSRAKFKFIFAHHMVGGTEDYVRGGANGVPFTEWGGYDEDGTTWGFDSRRPGWYAPIHRLLVENHVSAFFHGHDHEFAHEERDGVVYQLVPMAADATYGFGSFQLYHEADPFTLRVLPNSGHLRVTVSPTKTTVDYIKAFLPGDGFNGELAYTYDINAPHPPDTAPPVLSSVIAEPAADGTAAISWTSNEPSDSRVDYGTSPALGSSVANSDLVTAHSLSLTGLSSNTTYYYRVVSADAAGNVATVPADAPASFATPPQTVTGFPAIAIVQSGTLLFGSAASLAADDNAYFLFSSATLDTHITSAFAAFENVPNNLRNLRVNFQGRNSRSCSQTISVWRWSTKNWVQIDSRLVGTGEVLLADMVTPGAPASFVSGDSGNGELRVRIQCSSGISKFVSSWDLLSIVYEE